MMDIEMVSLERFKFTYKFRKISELFTLNIDKRLPASF